MNFEAFEKIPRWSREVCITEKIDGTNAQILVTERCMFADDNAWMAEREKEGAIIVETDKYSRVLRAGSRSRYLTEHQDNYGWWKWVYEHRDELAWLGLGRHFGEWWGMGIQRRYGLSERRFSLFNAVRWPADKRPPCCHTVPILYRGTLFGTTIDEVMDALKTGGSAAAKERSVEGKGRAVVSEMDSVTHGLLGTVRESETIEPFLDPEGIIIYHTGSSQYFKKTFVGDQEGKERFIAKAKEAA